MLLAGGYRNEVWKVRAGRRWLIEKRYAEDPGEPNPMYPNLPDHEVAALALLGPIGLAPRLVSFEPGVLTYEFVTGSMWRPGRRKGVEQVAAMLHAVHSLPAPRDMRSLCGSATEARSHGDEMVSASASPQAAVALSAVRPANVSDRMVRRRSLVHTDCGPGNLVRTRHGLVLIDWQCPGRGDAVEDIACFLSPAMMILYECPPHTRVARDAFLAAYGDRPAVARYRRDAAAWHYRIGAYCVWRAHRLARRQPEVAARYRSALAAEIEFIAGLA
jgi:thiamine kinase